MNFTSNTYQKHQHQFQYNSSANPSNGQLNLNNQMPMNNVIQQLKKVLPPTSSTVSTSSSISSSSMQLPPPQPSAPQALKTTPEYAYKQFILPQAPTPPHQTMHSSQDVFFDDFVHNSLLFNGIRRPTPMLDNGAAKSKSLLIKRSSLASRQLPLQQQQQQNCSPGQLKKFYTDQER